MTKVYIAAPYPTLREAARLKAWLQGYDVEVTSSWLDGSPDLYSDKFARRDLEDIDAADAVVVMNPELFHEAGTGGRHVELGYALGKGKLCILLGERSNMFHYLYSVRIAKRFHDILEFLCAVRH